MSYIRGKWYAYTSGDSDDPKDQTVTLHGLESHCGCGGHDKEPSISMPMVVFDALVLMRHAEMKEEDKMRALAFTIDHARGNAGASDLLDRLGVASYYDEEQKWFDHFASLPESFEIKRKPRRHKGHKHLRAHRKPLIKAKVRKKK